MLIKNRYYVRLFLLSLFLALTSCGNADTASNSEFVESTSPNTNESTPVQEIPDKKFIQCTEPRPQICTREYNPVCARLRDGNMKTYATGCTACADTKVTGYSHGACK